MDALMKDIELLKGIEEAHEAIARLESEESLGSLSRLRPQQIYTPSWPIWRRRGTRYFSPRWK
jgi:hypothetical protein